MTKLVGRLDVESEDKKKMSEMTSGFVRSNWWMAVSLSDAGKLKGAQV